MFLIFERGPKFGAARQIIWWPSAAFFETGLFLFFSLRLRVQATVVWRWWNYLFKNVPRQRQVVTINLDESSVPLFQPGPAGNVVLRPSLARNVRHHASRRLRRMNVTVIGVICDDVAIQRCLPQFVLANEATFLKREFAGLQNICHENVKLYRRRSAWTDAAFMSEVVREIWRSLLPFTRHIQPVLIWDAARQHTQAHVLKSCSRLGIWPVVLPAGSTSLLQPLDTHCFNVFKRELASKCERSAATWSCMNFVTAVNAVFVDIIINGSWQHAFVSNGFSEEQGGVSERVLGVIGGMPQDVGHDRPTIEDLTLIFPRRSRIEEHAIFAQFAIQPYNRKRVRPEVVQRREVMGRTRSETIALRARLSVHFCHRLDMLEFAFWQVLPNCG